MAIRDNTYLDKIMGGVQGDPLTNISNEFARSGTGIDQGFINQYNLGQRYDSMFDNEDFKEIPGFNFIDQPTSLKSRMENPQFLNNPRRGFIDNFLMQKGNPGNTIIDKAKSGISKGFDLGKAAIGGIASLVSGVPGLGLLFNALGPMSPEEKAMKDFYESQFGLDDIGRIQSGIMQGYNPVSMFGGPGLSKSIDKRISRIQKTLKKKKSDTLQKRLQALEALRQKEEQAREKDRADRARAANPEVYANLAAATGGKGYGDAGGFSTAKAGKEGAFGTFDGSRGRKDYSKGGVTSLKRKGFKGGGADMGDTGRAQERADRGYGSTAGVDRPGNNKNNNNNNNNNNNKISKNFSEFNVNDIKNPEILFNQNLPFNIASLKGKIFMDNILDNDDIQLDSEFSTNLPFGLNTNTEITEQGIDPTSLSYNDITALIDQNKNLQNIQYNKGPFSVGYSGDGNYELGLKFNYANGGIVSLL